MYRRWTRKWPKHSLQWWWNSVVFAWQHYKHSSKGTGLGEVRWNSGPIPKSIALEKASYSPKGSCGECINCCTTYWEGQNARNCPFLLTGGGCSVYNGLWWNYYNCGRFPTRQVQIDSYECPRYEIKS